MKVQHNDLYIHKSNGLMLLIHSPNHYLGEERHLNISFLQSKVKVDHRSFAALLSSELAHIVRVLPLEYHS